MVVSSVTEQWNMSPRSDTSVLCPRGCRPRSFMMAALMSISILSMSFNGLGAEWKMEKDEDFKAPGHELEGLEVSDDMLTLAHEVKTYMQKDWTGGPGQSEWLDATSYLSASGIDGSTPGKVTLDKESWTKRADAPTARREHVAVWDEVRNRMLVFGGAYDDGNLDDIWTYDPVSDTWTEKGTAPSARYWHSGSWAAQREEMLVHGGLTSTGSTTKTLNDTWAFDSGSEVWTQMSDSPERRYSHTTVWDPVNLRLLVFGGYAESGVSKDLWSFDPVTGEWEKKKSNTVGLYEHTAVWADSLGVMLVYGGLKGGGLSSKDLWSYAPQSDSWAQLKNGGTPRSGHAAFWDDENDRMLVVGGHEGQTKYNETWVYEPATDSWYRGKDLPGVPRTGLTAVWDPRYDRAVAYGGKVGALETAEVWEFSPFYAKAGTLVSSAFEVADASDLVNVTWQAGSNVPDCSGASIRFQIATSDSLTASSFIFMGPDGTGSYYKNGEAIDKAHYGKRYVRYKAHLSSSDGKCVPVLEEVWVNYRVFVMAGNYTTQAFDTGSTGPNYISLEYDYDNPSGTEVTVQLRSSFTVDMSSPSDWEVVRPKDTSFTTPQRRYVQFRVGMTTTDPGRTPYLGGIALVYNSIPELITSPVLPEEGGTEVEFVYRVMYRDGDGETPTVYKVVIDGKTYDMEPETYDYRSGANFTYSTKLPSGAHRFSFEFSDGMNLTRAPAEGEFDGPVVNDPPVPSLKAAKRAETGQKVKFDASGSSDPDGGIAQCKFDFGDGSDSGWQNESTAWHTYKKKGTFLVKVHVRDDLGAEGVSSGAEIKVEEASGFVPWAGPLSTMAALTIASMASSMGRGKRRRRP
jgi:N-acetylneuraminic acid mutarotase